VSQTLERGLASFDEKLWNGQYYVLWRDTRTGDVDECCMSDQVSAEWFFASCGWDPLLPEDRVRSAMRSVVKHNFHPDRGLINAAYPPAVPHRTPTSGNLQQDATWTGIEYTVAALLVRLGMVEEALDITRDIHIRHIRAGRFWNHVECGDHYYRAMSAWTLLLTASGSGGTPRQERSASIPAPASAPSAARSPRRETWVATRRTATLRRSSCGRERWRFGESSFRVSRASGLWS